MFGFYVHPFLMWLYFCINGGYIDIYGCGVGIGKILKLKVVDILFYLFKKFK